MVKLRDSDDQSVPVRHTVRHEQDYSPLLCLGYSRLFPFGLSRFGNYPFGMFRFVIYRLAFFAVLRVHFALRPQKRDGLLGTGTGGGGGVDERLKARPRIPPEKDRRDRGPPPEQCTVLGIHFALRPQKRDGLLGTGTGGGGGAGGWGGGGRKVLRVAPFFYTDPTHVW